MALKLEDFVTVFEGIDRSKTIAERYAEHGIDADEMKLWLLSELPVPDAGTFGAGIEFGLALAKYLREKEGTHFNFGERW